MSEPRWIDGRALALLHNENVAQHGGSPGLRDEAAYETALLRPRNLYISQGVQNVPELAASYAYGLTRDRPFSDGNKRAAFEALGLFLLLNGWRLTAAPDEAARRVLALASGDTTELEFAGWIRANSEPK